MAESPTLWQRLTGSVASVAESAKKMVTPTPAEPLLSDSATSSALGTAPESSGTTITGGRRRKTRKGRKAHKKTRKQRKH